MSQSWCQLTGGWGHSSGNPKVSADSVVGGARLQSEWLCVQGLGSTVSLLVGCQFLTYLAAGFTVSTASFSLLVSGTGFQVLTQWAGLLWSWSWCWPTGQHIWGIEGSGAVICPLVGRVRS